MPLIFQSNEMHSTLQEALRLSFSSSAASEMKNSSSTGSSITAHTVTLLSAIDVITQAMHYVGLTMPILLVTFSLTGYLILRCPWRSGNPSVYTRLRRIGLSPVVVRHQGGGAKFHPLYIPHRPYPKNRQKESPHQFRDD